MGRYVALLRGINVGGKNLVKMTALAACFEEHGFRNVSTYIQSGNVLFDASERSTATLVPRIEAMLTRAYGYPASVVVLSGRHLRRVVEQAPEAFALQPVRHRCDVLFLKPPLTAEAALESVPTRPGVDRVWPGPGVLYFARLTARAAESRLGRVVAMPIYKSMTIRNWNTTRQLLQRLDESRA